jgi:ferredoxin-NADP reductase
MFLNKPKGFRMVHGQFIYINVPSVNLFQWHPFTIASSPDNPYLILMIKRAGDWTNKLVDLMFERKKQMMKFNGLNFHEFEDYDVFNLLHDLHQEIPLKDMRLRNRIYYPKINIGPACTTPNDTFIDRRNIVLIGAGSGISPYLPLLEEVIKLDKGKKNNFDFET